jgi:uncharacterized membrane protein
MLFIAFVGLLIAVIVFLGRSQKKVKRVLCNIYYLPSGVIDGIKDEGNEFIGLGHLRNTYESFKTEQNNLKGLTVDMNAVISKNLDELSSGAVQTLKNFVAESK